MNRTFAKNILVFVPLIKHLKDVSLHHNDTLKRLHNHCKNIPLVDEADLLRNDK